MKRKLLALFFVLICSFTFLTEVLNKGIVLANTKNFNCDGEKKGFGVSEKNNSILYQTIQTKLNSFADLTSITDTLSNLKMWIPSASRIDLYGQDVLLQWFIAPADLIIKEINFRTYSAAPDGSTLSIRLFKLNSWWNFERLSEANGTHWGYFPAVGDGFNEVTPFPNEASGSFEDSSGLGCPGVLADCIWSNPDGSGYNVLPVSATITSVQTNTLGIEPSVYKGEIIAVVLQNNSTVLQYAPNQLDSRIRITANSSPPAVGYHSFKFSENGSFGIDNGVGWFSYELDFYVSLVVDLISDRAPRVINLTNLANTYSTAPMQVDAEITDDNPGGGVSGINSVYLYYRANNSAPDSIAMIYTGGNNYTAEIPGYYYGTNVIYYIKATDIEGNVSLPFGYSYNVLNFNDFYSFININKIKMWQSNNGIGSYDPAGKSGFYWNYEETDTTSAIFSDGLLWAGYVDGNLKVGGSRYISGLQAGKIISTGIPDSVNSPRNRVYRIRKDWESLPPGSLRDSFETDYNQWPAEDGAPWIDINDDGIFTRGVDVPEFIGDEVLWFVSNDLDTARVRSLYNTDPIGIEVQLTTFAFDSTNDLADIIFKKYRLINKSGNNISDLYLSYWSDPDLGNPGDDFVGCDTVRNLGYTYNVNEYDNLYGSPPPAVGYNLLRGPIVPAESYQFGFINGKWKQGFANLKMTAFIPGIAGDALFSDPSNSIYAGAVQTYNFMKGLDRNGNPIINQITGLVTKYCFDGDPVTSTGWTNQVYGNLSDKRHYISMGPFNMAASDTQEVMLAILIDEGTDRLNSITELKNKDEFLQSFYYDNFLTPLPSFEISCDMSIQILDGAFNPASDQVKVMADFNSWIGDIMTDLDNDSIYTFTLSNVAFDSTINFKFWVTPDRWEGYPDTRTVEIGSFPGGFSSYFNDDETISLLKNIVVKYQCDMSIEISSGRFNTSTDTVKLMGWQYWWGTGVEMVDVGFNVYEFIDTLLLGPNDCIAGYKFFYTPDVWEGGENKIYRISQGEYDYGEITIHRLFNQDQLPSVEFQCDMTVQILEGNFNPSTDQVQVRGNFNGWSGTELTDPDNDWIYTNLIFNFEVDSHLVYKYWHSSDTWEDDPNREYTVVANPQTLYDYFNRDDDPTNGERFWEAQTSNTGNALMEVGFINDIKGWTVGDIGTILNTSNGGEDWSAQTSGSDQTLWSVSFPDENNGWAVGNSGTILKTTDGGNNWNLVSGITSEPLREVFFYDVNTGWIVGNNGLISKTTDAGSSWYAQTTNTSLRFQSVFFIDPDNGWAVGQDGIIMHTTNGGSEWISQTSNTTNYLMDVHFENTNSGWAVGWNATILRTTDGGNNWTVKDAKLPLGGIRNRLYNVWFTSMFYGWAVGTYGTIRYTTDGGENWLPQYSGTKQDLFGVMFPTNNFGWAVGGNGTVLKYLNQTPVDWAVGLTVADAGGTDASNNLTFGQNLSATDGIDPSLGEEEIPPPPPSGIFDVRFILPDPTITSLIDYRNSAKTRIDWIIQFQPGTAGYPITFTWDQYQLPTGSLYLKDLFGDLIVNINMHEQNSYTITDPGINSLKIEFIKQTCTEVGVIGGWNMLSIPLEMTNMSVDNVYANATSEAFGFTNQYVVCDTFETGKGYWLRFDVPDSTQLCGIITVDSISVQSGWNIIGVFEFDLPTNQITTNPPGIITSNYFGFNNGYHTTTTLETGKGYWVKVNQDGVLRYNRLQKISVNTELVEVTNDWGKIIISDKNNSSTTLFTADKELNLDLFELPPLPPSGIFDVRYKTNRIAESIESSRDVLITSAQYPVTVKVEGVSARFRDKIDGNRVNKLLKSGEELLINDPAITLLEVTGELVPTRFELFQNYPNPFNPSTTIQFALPVASRVKIVIFNILGEQVKILSDKEFDVGYHKIIFNANAYASGVYFYRIEAMSNGKNAGNFMDVKKMMIIK